MMVTIFWGIGVLEVGEVTFLEVGFKGHYSCVGWYIIGMCVLIWCFEGFDYLILNFICGCF